MRSVAQKTNYYQHSSINFKNYIYLKYYNYLKYSSIAPETYFKNFEKDLLPRKMFFSQALKSKDKEYLEKYLNTFFPRNRQGKLTSGIKENIYNNIVEAALKEFNQRYNSYNVDLNKLSVTESNKQLKTALGKIKNFDNHYVAPWDEKIKKLNKELEELQVSSGENYNLLNNKLNALTKQWNDIVNSIPGVKVDKNTGKRSGVLNVENISNFSKFQQAYNDLSKSLLLEKGKNSAQGELAEIIIAAALSGLGKTANSTISDIEKDIKQMLTGGKNQATHKGVNINEQGVLSNKQWEEVYNQKLLKYNGNLFTMGASQNKTDIHFQFKGREINASVKNYNLNRGNNIHLVDKAPLLTMIQKDSEFVSHYLNVLSQHGYYSNEIKYEPSFKIKSMAHGLMRKLIFARSLAGGGTYEFRRDLTTGYSPQVDIFILNDSNQGRIKIYFINDIINKVFEDISLMSIAEKIKKKSKGISYDLQGYPSNNNYSYSIDGWQKWLWYPPRGDYGRRRRTKLYQQLHTIKIQSSVSIDLFKADFGY